MSSDAVKRKREMPVGLAERMKHYEEATGTSVPPERFLVIRADGHRFSKFTQGFKKPFDERITAAMMATAEDLLEAFCACTAFTFSDEISLVLPIPTERSFEYPYNGRVQKIASSVAGLCSVRFAYHMAQQEFSNEEKRVRERVMAQQAYFDARVIDFPSREEVVNHFVWRSRYDCQRNSIANLARYTLGQKAVHGKKGHEMKEMVPWDALPGHYKWGSYLKKEQFIMDAIDRKTGEPVKAVRTRVVTKVLEDMTPSDKYMDLLFAKHWPSTTERESRCVNENKK